MQTCACTKGVKEVPPGKGGSSKESPRACSGTPKWKNKMFCFFFKGGRKISNCEWEIEEMRGVCGLLDQKGRRQWRSTPVLLPGKSHGRRSLVGCSPWGREESDTTERLHFHFSLSCIGEGNGNPLQCSCLENPRDGGAWWAAVYGVTQSRTRLKRLSSSSSSRSERGTFSHTSWIGWRTSGWAVSLRFFPKIGLPQSPRVSTGHQVPLKPLPQALTGSPGWGYGPTALISARGGRQGQEQQSVGGKSGRIIQMQVSSKQRFPLRNHSDEI